MFKKISYLIDYFKYIQNPINALKFKFGISKTCNLKIKNCDHSITLHNVSSINYLMSIVPIVSNNKMTEFLEYVKEIDDDKKILTINGIHFVNTLNKDFLKNNKHDYCIHIIEFFTDDEWNMVNFSKRHVIDLGGNIGDTALYFAKKGAEVISFEPVQHLHELAIKNLDINKEYSDKITLVNKGVGGKTGTITFDSTSVKSYADKDSDYMEIISFQDLLSDYEFTPDILKMDCEGCEFEVIPNNDLTMFNDIIFEHHSEITGKDYNILIDALKKQGFKINCYKVHSTKESFEKIGIIHAFK